MENTIENYERFVSQYWLQPVLRLKEFPNMPIQVNSQTAFKYLHNNESYLELTPLHLISDEHLANICEISDITIGTHELDKFKDLYSLREWLLTYGVWCDMMLDYIRSNGFAYRYNGLSVSEQVSRNWVRLRTEI